MAGQSAVPLVAVLLPRPAAAAAVHEAWDRGEAVAILDPAAPAAVLERLIAVVQPTHVLDGDGRRDHPGGAPVQLGTAAIVTTSGTTGAPKGVELTVVGLEAIGRGFAAALDAPADDRWLVCLPLHHVAGLAILARARVSGAPITVHPAFDVDAVATAPRSAGATLVSVVPTMLHRLLEWRAPLDAYRRIVVGGAPMPPELRTRAEQAGAHVVDAYGLSETWGGIALDGVPVPGVEMRLSEADEILVRGDMVMRAYRGRPDDTAAAFTSDGFFRTGDVGVIDEGRFRVLDRARDFVITGGVNVSPTAVEAVLAEHPGIDDLCVTGAVDEEWGERVVAFVVIRADAPSPSLDELRSFARDRLSAAQLPRELVLVESIPRTAGGKPLRRDLREREHQERET
jgi:o-succinylbenzoate---CoA ligase